MDKTLERGQTTNMSQGHHHGFPIICACGRSYSREDWLVLCFDGIQTGYHEKKRRQIFDDLEMRRCLCGSTMTVPVKDLR